jgi:hypothetical protein
MYSLVFSSMDHVPLPRIAPRAISQRAIKFNKHRAPSSVQGTGYIGEMKSSPVLWACAWPGIWVVGGFSVYPIFRGFRVVGWFDFSGKEVKKPTLPKPGRIGHPEKHISDTQRSRIAAESSTGTLACAVFVIVPCSTIYVLEPAAAHKPAQARVPVLLGCPRLDDGAPLRQH